MALDFTDDVFSAEDVQFVIQNAIKNVCTNPDVPYSNKNINNVINNIASDCLRDLEKLKRPFKYVVTCIIMQKNGAGMNTAAATFWDASKDGQVYGRHVLTMHLLYIRVYVAKSSRRYGILNANESYRR
mmetsp:Transcript_67792/g.187296  ORF Transcript_67792/g.187296 Transcript_67792/m.187296 type:complete len:129 (-) Transcript_67792:920-1306(-)